MTIKTVLVHFDDAARRGARLDASARLARDHGARLIGVYLVPTPEISPSVAAALPQAFVDRRMQEARESQEAAEVAFRNAAAKMGVERIEWRAPAGDPIPAMLAHARYADLIVVGQRDPDNGSMLFASELLSTALFGSGRPLLVVPYIGAQPTIGKRILVACDGGREAVRAIGDAMTLLERAAAVDILLGDRDDAGEPSFATKSTRLSGWLGDHGIQARIERYEPGSLDKGEMLLSRAADLGSDLVVMGGYGHARLRELVLGGMTRTMLRQMTVPVLLSH